MTFRFLSIIKLLSVFFFQVYEEKQKRCEQEMEELRQSCATKMKQVQQKAQRTQQVLQLQVFQLQQEKKKLQEDFSQLLQERETLEKRCASIERQQNQLGPRLEETKWEVRTRTTLKFQKIFYIKCETFKYGVKLKQDKPYKCKSSHHYGSCLGFVRNKI